MQINFKSVIIFILIASACSKPLQDEESTVRAKVSVQVVELSKGIVKDELSLSSSTMYLKRNVVTAPIPSFINQVYIKLGDFVKEGQELYLLETKEGKALGKQAVMPDSSSISFGKVVVTAPASGIISTIDKQELGDYVLEGAQLCTIAKSNELVFAVNVPFEYTPFAKSGMKCSLVFPDNSIHEATFTTPLSSMNALAQTQTILAKSDGQVILPENLIVRVIVNKKNNKLQQVLPKECVLSDEMLENFWVMELVNDSTAVRKDVTLGNRSRESVEILTPTFKPDSKFLITGNYGLPDTAFVKVIH